MIKKIMNNFKGVTQSVNTLGIAFYIVFLGALPACQMLPWQTQQTVTTPDGKVHALAKELSEQPNNVVLRNRWYQEREQAIYDLTIAAEAADAHGDIASAKALYARVLTLDPYHRKALDYDHTSHRDQVLNKQLDEAKKHFDQPTQAQKQVKDVLLEQPGNPEAKALENKLVAMEPKARAPLPQLQFGLHKPVSLELRDANIKVVFEALTKATGVSFILDKDIKPDMKASVFIKKIPVEDAIDMVLASNGLQKKVLSANSALVYPATSQKNKDYQDLLIRNFYFSNTSAKQCADMLKAILKIKDVYVDERLNMLVLRERPEVITLAEKMIRAQDIADPEVMLEIEVLEVTRNKLKQVGITYPNQLSVVNSPLTLDILKSIHDTNLSVTPNPSVQFGATDSDVDLLSNPRIRVKNNEKAKVNVGSKVPVITTNTTANVGTSESVSYIDVGLKLEVEPKILLDDFVSIKVNLEVSSLGDAVILTNGSKVYNIGTRNANTVLRLRHGETQILAGLIQDADRRNVNKLPGFGDIPILGRLFSNHTDEKDKTEIVLAITPKILSNVTLPEATFSEYWSGTDTIISDKPMLNNVPMTSSNRTNHLQEIRELQSQRNGDTNAGNTAGQSSEPVNGDANAEAEPVTEPSPPDNTPAPSSVPGNVTNGVREMTTPLDAPVPKTLDTEQLPTPTQVAPSVMP